MSQKSAIHPTQMRREIEEIPDALERLVDNTSDDIIRAAEKLRKADPRFIMTIARGSSDHCASYLKYVFEIYAGIPVASLAPSIASIYNSTLHLENSISLAISQSGQSPDIVETAQMSREGGAIAFAFTNNTKSPLADTCNFAFDIAAGPEKSVAATKTFVNSVAAGLLLMAHWMEDEDLLKAIHKLPDQCRQAIDCRWDHLLARLHEADTLYVLGRGPTYAIAEEVALKFKETCQIHAEAYSAAEVMHGPVSIVGGGFPAMVLAGRDASREAVSETIGKLQQSGADVFTTLDCSAGVNPLNTIATGHPITDPLPIIVSFYAFIEELARLRGRNPDLPPNLRKVTETV